MQAAMWLAVGTGAGVLLGVALADRGGARRLLRRAMQAMATFERLKGLVGAIDTGDEEEGTGSQASNRYSDVPFDEDLDEELDYDDDEAIEEEDSVELEGTGFEPDVPDSFIDERVLAAFEQDPILATRNIVIEEPEPGMIALTGKVATQRDAKHAVTVARGVPGVERVENYIRVRHRAPVSPPPEKADV